MKKSNKINRLRRVTPATSEECAFGQPSCTKNTHDWIPTEYEQNARAKECESQEKRAEYANCRIKNKGNTILPTVAAPSGLRREYLQKLVDTRCAVITQHYYEEDAKLHEAFNKASVNTSTAQYPIVGSAPHEIEFVDQSSSLMRSYTAELRELRGICNSFALKTNPLLDRVFGCNAQ